MASDNTSPASLPPDSSSHPMLLLAACFAAGIVAAEIVGGGSGLLAACLLVVGVSLLAGLLALRASRELVAHAALAAGLVASGAAAMPLFALRFPPGHVRHWSANDLAAPVRLEGQIVSTPERTPDQLQFDLEVQQWERGQRTRTAQGKVRLRLYVGDDPESLDLAEALHLELGDRLRVVAQLRRPRVYRNPGSFDFARWLESVEDIPLVGAVRSPREIEKLSSPGSPRLGRALQSLRRRLLEGIDQTFPPWSRQGREGSVLKAVLLGDNSSLSTDTVENFRRTGLYHQLVVSGMQLGLLAFLVGLLLGTVRVKENVQIFLLLAAMIGYALLLEQRAPTLRATLMIFVYLAARFLYREHALLNAVGASALILLLWRPFWLLESGFQLSFSAALLIAGLAVPIIETTTEPYRRALRQLLDSERDMHFAPRPAQFRLDLRSLASALSRRVPWLGARPHLAAKVISAPMEGLLWVASTLLFSAILQIGLLMPMTETFHRVTIAGIVLNALATPLMTLMLGLAAPTVALAAVSPAAAAIPGRLLSLVTSGFIKVAEFEGFPAWVSYRVPDPPLWVSLGFAICIAWAGWALVPPRRRLWPALGGAALFAALISFPAFAPRLPQGALEVTALDCGGEALFIVFPEGKTMLVDACASRTASPGGLSRGSWDQGENVVSPYLWSRGISRIDRVVLADVRQDHLGGMAAVFRNFRVAEFWHARHPMTAAYTQLMQEADRLGIQDRLLGAGQTLDFGGGRIEVLWPPENQAGGDDSKDSLVLRISAAGGSVLLTGDIDRDTEAELLRRGVPLASQVLKVAAHGARNATASAFLERARPEVALIAQGRGRFREAPSEETLARLAAAGARVLRTDRDGAVTVLVRDGRLQIQTWQDLSWTSSAPSFAVLSVFRKE